MPSLPLTGTPLVGPVFMSVLSVQTLKTRPNNYISSAGSQKGPGPSRPWAFARPFVKPLGRTRAHKRVQRPNLVRPLCARRFDGITFVSRKRSRCRNRVWRV